MCVCVCDGGWGQEEGVGSSSDDWKLSFVVDEFAWIRWRSPVVTAGSRISMATLYQCTM